MEALKELLTFLHDDSRIDLKLLALHEILCLTGNKEGCQLLYKEVGILKCLCKSVSSSNSSISKDSSLSLVNLSSSEEGAKSLLDLFTHDEEINIISILVEEVSNENSSVADPACMILSNLSRHSSLTDRVIQQLDSCTITLDKLVHIFTKINFNKKGCHLHYLGPFFSNLSQTAHFRRYILDKERCVIQRLLPFTEYKESSIRRGGIVGTLRNCCFDVESHDWLIGPDVDIAPRLVLPLAGPEEFDEEDNDKLPVDLQYLGDDKQRECDPDIRKMLLEALHQLCATRSGRENLRNMNIYVILREYHKWEKDREVLLACENLIDILIRTEDEIGEENLKELEVPEEYIEKFNKMDEEFIKDV